MEAKPASLSVPELAALQAGWVVGLPASERKDLQLVGSHRCVIRHRQTVYDAVFAPT